MSQQQELFGRYNDVVLLVLGFFLTGVAGTVVSQRVQDRSWLLQRDQERRQREVDRATQVFDDVSRLLDRRLYRSRQVLWSFQTAIPAADSALRWADYRAILYDWNDNLNRNLAMVERYFGDEMREQLEVQIHGGLRNLGTQLDAIRQNHADVADELQAAGKLADHINVAVYVFDRSMLQMIQTGDVGAFKQLPRPR